MKYGRRTGMMAETEKTQTCPDCGEELEPEEIVRQNSSGILYFVQDCARCNIGWVQGMVGTIPKHLKERPGYMEALEALRKEA